HQALVEGDLGTAETVAEQVISQAKTQQLKVAATHIFAFAKIEGGDPKQALLTLERLAPEQIDPFLQGACLLALDRFDEAIPPLERAAESGEQPRAKELLIEAFEQNGQHERAQELRHAIANTDI
ncbi:MAG: hypothetical protein CSA75_05305, partial [Sorangium cellulosum]